VIAIAALAAGSVFLESLKNNYSDHSPGCIGAETGNDKLSNKLSTDYLSRAFARSLARSRDALRAYSHAESLLAPATSN